MTFPTGGTSGAPIDLVSLAGAPSSAGLVDYLVDPTLSPNPSQRIFADLGAACDAALADGNPAKITVRGNVTTGPRSGELASAYVVPDGSVLCGATPLPVDFSGLGPDVVTLGDGSTFAGFDVFQDIGITTTSAGSAPLDSAFLLEGNTLMQRVAVLGGGATSNSVLRVLAAGTQVWVESSLFGDGGSQQVIDTGAFAPVIFQIDSRSRIEDDVFRNVVGGDTQVTFELGSEVSTTQTNAAGTFSIDPLSNTPAGILESAGPAPVFGTNLFAGGVGDSTEAVRRMAQLLYVLNGNTEIP